MFFSRFCRDRSARFDLALAMPQDRRFALFPPQTEASPSNTGRFRARNPGTCSDFCLKSKRFLTVFSVYSRSQEFKNAPANEALDTIRSGYFESPDSPVSIRRYSMTRATFCVSSAVQTQPVRIHSPPIFDSVFSWSQSDT